MENNIFFDKLQSDIFLNRNIFSDVIKKIKKFEKVIIWGTGVAGTMIHKSLRKNGVEIYAFSDSNSFQNGYTEKEGCKVISCFDIPKEACVVIAANYDYGIHDFLNGKEIKNWIYIDPFYLSAYSDVYVDKISKIYSDNSEKIKDVYSSLSDSKSRETFKAVLLHRAVHKIDTLWNYWERKQYFGNDVIKNVSGNFVDCGAYNGDTLRDFIDQVHGKEYLYYAFEPETDNYSTLRKYAEETDPERIKTYKLGIWDKKTKLCFVCDDEGGGETGRMVENENNEEVESVSVDSVDNILNGDRADFIKMDIEGAEIKALSGCCKTVGLWHPTMAISSYHELEHLWEVPIKILTLSEEYKLYYRHHSWNWVDTVCYGL